MTLLLFIVLFAVLALQYIKQEEIKMSPSAETRVTWLCVGLVTPHTVVTTERDPAC